MRIISGYAKGRSLQGPKDDSVRPTTDRVRESLFGILGDFSECVVVDGFAGTGALGCEALSRGAEFVYFFDKAPASIEVIEENLSRLEAADDAKVIGVPFIRGLARLEHEPDVVFLDPPYNKGLLLPALEALGSHPRVTARALVVVEQSTKEPPAEHEAFELDDERVYGDTRIRFLLRK